MLVSRTITVLCLLSIPPWLPALPAADTARGVVFHDENNNSKRDALLQHLHAQGIQSTFHYVPLHSAPAGLRFGRYAGKDRYTTEHSGRLLRLPLYYGFEHTDAVVGQIESFFKFM